MGSHDYLRAIRLVEIIWLILLSSAMWRQARSEVDCMTVTQLLNTCSVFISYGSPDPLPGSPCCDAVMSLNNFGDSPENRRSICRCLMGLIAIYNPNATALATLPGLCGISLGFVIDPNINCEMYGLDPFLSLFHSYKRRCSCPDLYS